MAELNLQTALVETIIEERAGVQIVAVRLGEEVQKAVNYLALGEEVKPGERVVVNTTAVDLALGSGGYHFVLPKTGQMSKGWGHQMKLRYTPLQLRVNAAEEQASPWHNLFCQRGGLEGTPVLAAELHSMVAPLALGIKALVPKARIVYLATEGGALPAAFSAAVAHLLQTGVIAKVITSGHSFGGDLETINLYTGLQAARQVARGDYIIAGMGPGIAGTGTVYGFSGMEQGAVLQAASVLGGQPLYVPRISFVDSRRRHWGLSHHCLTVLTDGCLGPAWLPLPLLSLAKSLAVSRQASNLPPRYRLRWLSGDFISKLVDGQPGLFSTMGRSFGENREYFLALGAAARMAVILDRSKKPPQGIAIK